MNINELRAEVVRNSLTLKELARRTGIVRSTLSRRFNNPSEFTLDEILAIKKVLKLNNARLAEIFFIEDVA